MEKSASNSNWEISLAREYKAFAQGEDSLEGRREEYPKAVRSKYYAFWEKAKGYMPVAIPLKEEEGSFADFSAVAGVSTGVVSFPAETYYLSGTNEVLRFSPGIHRWSPKIPPEYYPGNDKFVGIDVLRQEGLGKGVFFDPIKEGVQHPRGELTSDEVEIILGKSATQLESSPEKDSFVGLIQELGDLKKQELQVEQEVGDMIRQKVSKIFDMVPTKVLNKMPRLVLLLVDLDLLKQGKAVFFAKDNKTIITADYPEKGKEVRGEKDLTNVELAPMTLWIQYGDEIVDKLLGVLPQAVRWKIEHPERNSQ